MATDNFKPINDMLDKARKFVEEQKGQWDHLQWNQLLNDLQKKGLELSDEAKHRFGEVLEGMKGIYHQASQTEGVSKVLNTIKEQAIEFVQANKNGWDHSAWEKLLADIKSSGVNLTDETRTYLGNLVEALRKLSNTNPGGPTT